MEEITYIYVEGRPCPSFEGQPLLRGHNSDSVYEAPLRLSWLWPLPSGVGYIYLGFCIDSCVI